MVSSVISAGASALTSAGINAALGGGSGGGGGRRGFYRTNPGINSGAIIADPFKDGKKRGFNVSLGPEFENALGQFTSLSNAGADQLDSLRSRLTPGFSDLRDARLGALNSARSRTIGDLRDDLARRRVLGSSFANDTITRAESEFALQEADLMARTTLEEIDASVQLLNQATTLRLGAIEQTIAALNLEASVATSLATGAAANLTSMANVNAQLAAQNAAANAAGLGAFFQPAIDAVGSGASDFITRLLEGGGTAAPASPVKIKSDPGG